MKKVKLSRNQMLDKLHGGTVRVLIGVTVLGMANIGVQIYQYFTEQRPKQLEAMRIKREEQIEVEQNERELELLRRQKDAEELVD